MILDVARFITIYFRTLKMLSHTPLIISATLSAAAITFSIDAPVLMINLPPDISTVAIVENFQYLQHV